MKLLYGTIAGSRLYGINREDSDTDIRGVVFEPIEATIERAKVYFDYLSTIRTNLPKHPTFDTKSIIPLYKEYINESLEL